MDFDDFAAEAGRNAVESGTRAVRPSIEEVRSSRLKRAAIGATLVGFVGTLLVVGAIIVRPGDRAVTPGDTATSTLTTTTTTTTTSPAGPLILGAGDECSGIDNMPAGWRDEAFHVGPLWLWTVGSGETATQAIAVLEPGNESVTLRVPAASADRVAHLFDSSKWNSGGYYRLEDGGTDVTFVPCGDGYQQFVGGFVYSGEPCASLEFTIGDGDPAVASVPLQAGGCDEPPEMAIWSAAYPASWDRAGRELMPNLGWDSLTLATLPLRAGGSRCAHMPENALRDLGPAGALVSVFFAGDDAFTAAVPRPDRFDDTTFPAAEGTDAAVCAERDDLEIHWGPWNLDGHAVFLLVAFGDEVTTETRTTTWDVVSSLRPPADETAGPICVVTAPPSAGFVPPEPFPAEPFDGVWYGTADLWTRLPETGRSWGSPEGNTTFWWTSDLTRITDSTDVRVYARRLDGDGAVAGGGEGATGRTIDGVFTVVGVDVPAPGCWEMVAEHGDHALSYVVAVG